MVNELEFYNNHLWANVFTTDYLVKIDPQNGKLLYAYDLESLRKTEYAYNKEQNSRMENWDYENYVLNGIAFDEMSGHAFVTGKGWSLMFKLRI